MRKKGPIPEKATDRGPRINEMIRVPQVRVICEGEQVGIMRTEDALVLAQERGLDLVEVAPESRPPVCKVMDYGKFKYEKNRKDRASRKKQHVVQIKEVRIRPKTGEHDYLVKLNRAREFITKDYKVLVNVLFRGRERSHGEIAKQHLDRMAVELADVAKVEVEPKMEGHKMVMVLAKK